MKNRAIDAEEDRNLDDHRQTAGQRIHLILLVERHRFLRDLLAILAIFLLEFFDLRLQLLHRLARTDRANREGEQQRLHDDRKDNDGEAATMERDRQEVEHALKKF